mmetsp:Transcript_13536/g.42523  ORF Transcript_13536/g.42523 Transcript_13536/m.42523 type:complete len:200 (-) Transcript_13536:166-765(-)
MERLARRLEDVLDERLADGQHVWKLGPQLARAQLVVGAARLDDHGLLLHTKVLPFEAGVDVLAVELQHLAVRDGARVGVVEDARAAAQRQLDGIGQQLGQHRHAIGDVHHALVVRDLVDEVARVGGHRRIDGHAHAQCEHVVVRAQQRLDVALGHRVEAAVEVGLVGLGEGERLVQRHQRLGVVGRGAVVLPFLGKSYK